MILESTTHNGFSKCAFCCEILFSFALCVLFVSATERLRLVARPFVFSTLPIKSISFSLVLISSFLLAETKVRPFNSRLTASNSEVFPAPLSPTMCVTHSSLCLLSLRPLRFLCVSSFSNLVFRLC